MAYFRQGSGCSILDRYFKFVAVVGGSSIRLAISWCIARCIFHESYRFRSCRASTRARRCKRPYALGDCQNMTYSNIFPLSTCSDCWSLLVPLCFSFIEWLQSSQNANHEAKLWCKLGSKMYPIKRHGQSLLMLVHRGPFLCFIRGLSCKAW